MVDMRALHMEDVLTGASITRVANPLAESTLSLALLPTKVAANTNFNPTADVATETLINTSGIQTILPATPFSIPLTTLPTTTITSLFLTASAMGIPTQFGDMSIANPVAPSVPTSVPLIPTSAPLIPTSALPIVTLNTIFTMVPSGVSTASESVVGIESSISGSTAGIAGGTPSSPPSTTVVEVSGVWTTMLVPQQTTSWIVFPPQSTSFQDVPSAATPSDTSAESTTLASTSKSKHSDVVITIIVCLVFVFGALSASVFFYRRMQARRRRREMEGNP